MCLCGDTACPSCGPAQGYYRCPVCGLSDDDGEGCQTPDECNAAMDALEAELREIEELGLKSWPAENA